MTRPRGYVADKAIKPVRVPRVLQRSGLYVNRVYSRIGGLRYRVTLAPGEDDCGTLPGLRFEGQELNGGWPVMALDFARRVEHADFGHARAALRYMERVLQAEGEPDEDKAAGKPKGHRHYVGPAKVSAQTP